MREPDNRLDDRLRAGLRSLDDAAQQQIQAPGADAVPAAARRRRGTLLAAGTALALVLAVGWRFGLPAWTDPVGASSCAQVEGTAFLPVNRSDDLRTRVGSVLAGAPEVESVVYESKEQAWVRFKSQFHDAPDLVAATKPENLPDSWRFRLRCGADFAAVKRELAPLGGVEVVCSCEVGPGVSGVVTPSR